MSLNTPMPQGGNPSGSKFTCITCGITFITAELQRQHMKTEWHSYNLKRRVAQLPSISSEVFAEKVLQQRQRRPVDGEEDESGFWVPYRKRKNGPRQLTKKEMKRRGLLTRPGKSRLDDLRARSNSPAPSIRSHYSEFSLGESVADSQHMDFETESELNFTDSSYFTDLGTSSSEAGDNSESDEDSDSESDSEEFEEILPITYCFYCGANNKEVERNIRHMSNHHGLYLPERSFLVDVRGLLEYISEAVSANHECLACGFQGKSLEGLRQHMFMKGHCKIPYETKEEKDLVAKFYDFELSEEQEMKRNAEHATALHHAAGETEHESPGSTGKMVVHGTDIHSNYTTVQIDDSGVELILPSGSRIGHRSMLRYYRQNLPLPSQQPDSRKTVALASEGAVAGVSYPQLSKQEKTAKRSSVKAMNDHIRREKPKRVNFQPHFRDEILG
ncbi:Piso0_001329 [Millerozyma farinosa CBS 7064]|uniref:Piso0_001329 protein n=1 Tax=Pichia sorbitophila (strain ATCC MYA-4447 / BCRC 22081 / CBS 7064 / NBRC 10061 / NRRL Y-12695) TaxID=559304 RepID=G8YMG5_PICSO|nr:Piso0_001329 [Millerozyma farinosa CBS 7064]